jgi:S-DNA-T family DNA segregation ATPase FtsK/SpoIIIE
MAYQTRARDPLLDSKVAQAIEKRGKELLGLGLLAVGVMAMMLIASYSPDDPSWMSATDAPVQNWLGTLGASVAAPLFMIIGWGAWGLAIVPGVWGLRFVLHRGQERVIGRLIFAPIWIAVLALYASALTPGGAWNATHNFGLGGLFGDMALGTLLGVLPMSATLGVKLISVLLGALMLLFGAFVLGFNKAELMRLVRFMLVSMIMTYAGIMAVLGKGTTGAVKGAVKGAGALQARNSERRERLAREADAPRARRAMAEPRVSRPLEPVIEEVEEVAEVVEEAPVKTGGLLSRMPSLIRRQPEPEPEPELVELEAPDRGELPPGPERISARISDAIKSRGRPKPVVEDTSLTKGRGRGPDPLVFNAARGAELPPEPPLTAGMVQNEAYEPQQDEVLEQVSEHVSEPEFEVEPEPAEALHIPPHIPVAEQRSVVQHTPRKPVQPSQKAMAEAQPGLQFEEKQKVEYELPPLSLLANPVAIERHHLSDEALEQNARMLETVLDDYGVKGDIVSVRPGPVVTMYELEPAPGLKASRVIGLSDDIARSMSALSARVSTVPGRSVIGIELPNEHREKVMLREILANRGFGDGNQQLPIALGKDIGGDAMIVNLAKMPHLLIAGTTGSGKSVAINTMILSLLYKLTPDECRMIMIDPKMLELSVYDGIPHLLSPVVTDPKKAVVALKWVVGEMEERYRKMSKMGVRNIDGYNGRVDDTLAKNEMFSRTVQTGFDDATGEPVFETEEFAPERMPYIVVIVDEMADLMMVAGKEIEACIQRLAQMARASGIHLIMATQRPSVDVITGTIKANFPTRISFQVTSKIDSRTILGEMGAEQLLGMGDMLYMAGGGKITRCHGPFVSDEEVEEVVNNLKANGPPDYVSHVVAGPPEDKASSIDAVLGLGGNTDGEDALYDQAVQIVLTDRKCSTSYIQRKLAIGYNKAARLVEQMEDERIVSTANHVGKREILVPEEQGV